MKYQEYQYKVNTRVKIQNFLNAKGKIKKQT